jgi:hypothetical protein
VLRQLEHGFTLGSLTVSAPGGTQEIGLGVAMLLILIFRRSGIAGSQEIGWSLSRLMQGAGARYNVTGKIVAVSQHSPSVTGRREEPT